MSLVIGDTCITCSACFFECPEDAILTNEDNPISDDTFYVKVNECNLCKDYEMDPKCVKVCPTDSFSLSKKD